MGLTAAQFKQMLAPINPVRVLELRGNSHLSQQDVTAHLIRVFGFGGFNTEILECSLVYDTARTTPDGKVTGWDACYRVLMRLTIKDPVGNVVATYEDGSTGDASNQRTRADAHDLAMKSAISLAKKRCCINLGDQWGLSLYNKGQREALVKGTLVTPPGVEQTAEHGDIQEGVSPQVAMGVDETEIDKQAEPTEEQRAMLAQSLGATEVPSEGTPA